MNARHPLGTVARLWRYPIKSLLAEPLQRIEVAADGIVGDRRRALFVASAEHARSGRTYRGKEDNLLHTVATLAGARKLAAAHYVAVDEHDDGPYFDAEPISIVLDSWIRDLEDMLGVPLDPQRFRPNIFVTAAPGFAASEAALVGKSVAVGNVRLQVVATIKRCVTPTYDVDTGDATPNLLRTLAQRRENVMGIYCRPSVPGEVTLGDGLSLV